MMNKSTPKAMVAGHICLDIAPGFPAETQGDISHILTPGKLIDVQQAVIGTGGTVSNTGLAMAKLGMDVKLNGKVGDDAFGDIIKQRVGPHRASSFKTVSDQGTSYSIVLALPGIDRMFLHHAGTNDTFSMDDIDYDTLSQCDLLHFGYPPLMRRMYQNDGRELYEIVKRAREMGVIVSLDMSLPDPNSASGRANWPVILKKVLPYVDIFLPSIEEIAFMLDRNLFDRRKAQTGHNDPVTAYTTEDFSRLSSSMLNLGVKLAAIKAGINGFYLRTAKRQVIDSLPPVVHNTNHWSDRELWAPSYQADRFGSAVGAGDATIAGFLTAFLKGMDPISAIKAANILGAQSVREVDSIAGIENWPSTLEAIHDNSKLRNPLTRGIDWRFSELDQIYYGPNDQQTE